MREKEAIVPVGFHDNRLEGKTVLRQCQLVQLHLLYVFDAICKKHNLTYFLSGGSLLGAIRHKGFIPWDDDLDIGMPTKDYKKFLKIAPGILPTDTILHTPQLNPIFNTPYSKLRDINSFMYEFRRDQSSLDPQGIFIDIFPYDPMPRIGCRLQKILIQILSRSWNDARTYMRRTREGFLQAWSFSAYAMCLKGIYWVMKGLVSLLNQIIPSNDVYLCLEWGRWNFHWYQYDIYPTVEVPFEDGVFPIPHNYDKVLRDQYGDWTQIPPEGERLIHGGILLPTTPQFSQDCRK